MFADWFANLVADWRVAFPLALWVAVAFLAAVSVWCVARGVRSC